MKIASLVVSILWLLCACHPGTSNKEFSNAIHVMDSLVQHKMFFTAHEYARIHQDEFSPYDSLKSHAVLDHIFNRPNHAVERIEIILAEYKSSLPDTVKLQLFNLLQMNYGKLGQYKKAYETTSTMLGQFTSSLPVSEKEDYLNMNKIWQNLMNQKPPTIVTNGEVPIRMTRDKLGLQNLPVTNGKVAYDFIFDTGANLSTVTESIAKKWALWMADSTIDVSSISGKKVKAHLAVGNRLYINNITADNLVFLVFPDSALFIEQVPYQINGILGFPLFNALGEIQITKQDDFIVPLHHTQSKLRNMALDFLNPVIELDGDSYTFDTGADETILYLPYYTKLKKELDAKYQVQNLLLTGVGGSEHKKGMIIDFETTINELKVRADSVQLFTENIKAGGEYYFGNIGQDITSQYDTMILNFKNMFILFR
ncbi:MAG: retropepsin-like domain-containing protein [Saprospiraceae bacterium]|nr:retropepsin-like domain-containing protein [Saprospiraceae bacterium]